MLRFIAAVVLLGTYGAARRTVTPLESRNGKKLRPMTRDMPLTDYVLGFTRDLERSMIDAAIIDEMAPSENLEMASRIVVQWAAQEGGDAAYLGADISSRGAFATSIEQGVREIVRAFTRTAARDGLDFGAPAPRATCATIGDAVHALNELARWAAPYVDRVVVGARLPDTFDAALLDAAVARSTTAIRWLVVRDERTPLRVSPMLSQKTYERLDTTSLGAAREHLRRFLRTSGPNVLVYPAPPLRGTHWVESELRLHTLESEIITLDCSDCNLPQAAIRALVALDAHERTAGDPIRELGIALDERAASRPIVLVPATTTREPRFEPAKRLAESVLHPRARVILVDEAVTEPPSPAITAHHPFRIDATRIEAGLRACVARPDLEVEKRISYETALASFASGHGHFAEALAHAESALSLALEHERADLAVTSLYVVGSVLGRGGKTEEALRAWACSAETALDLDQPMIAGRALSAIGHVYFRFNLREPAIRSYLAAIELAEEAGDEPGVMHALTWLAEAQILDGKEAEGASLLDRVASTSVPGIDALLAPQRGEAHARLARLLTRVGLVERAARATQRAAECGYSGPLTACPAHQGDA